MFTKLDRYIRDYQFNKNNKNPIFISNGGLDKIISNLENELVDLLPHGSGIDCAWSINRVKDLVFDCHNSYHAMDQNGYYCGYVSFTVTIDLLTKYFDVEVSQNDIKVIEDDYDEYITGDDVETNAPYLDDLDDYLHQTIYQAIDCYYASETINNLVNDNYYRTLVKRALEEFESGPT